MVNIVYFSTKSENTHRFVQKLGFDSYRIPLGTDKSAPCSFIDENELATAPYVIIVPTYGGGGSKGAVPPQVIRFLKQPQNAQYIRGVIPAGNTNFGEAYCLAGKIISARLQVPQLYRFELLGTPEDVDKVQKGLVAFWEHLATLESSN